MKKFVKETDAPKSKPAGQFVPVVAPVAPPIGLMVHRRQRLMPVDGSRKGQIAMLVLDNQLPQFPVQYAQVVKIQSTVHGQTNLIAREQAV